jgi:hypothetical protein
MAEKKGWFSRLVGTQQSSCCTVRIEEVADESAATAHGPSTGGQSCCGGAPVETTAIEVNGKTVVIPDLDDVLATVKRMHLSDSRDVREQLTSLVRQRHTIPAHEETAYQEALWLRYQEAV